jgi:hypothetical protein
MAGQYNQAGTVREAFRPYKLAGKLHLLLSICTRRREHLQKENTSKELREVSLCGLCQAKTVEGCFTSWTCIFFCRRLYFVDAYILSTPLFSRCLYFVDAYVFVDTHILWTPIFCGRPYFVAYVSSTPIFCQRLYFLDAYIFADIYIWSAPMFS